MYRLLFGQIAPRLLCVLPMAELLVSGALREHNRCSNNRFSSSVDYYPCLKTDGFLFVVKVTLLFYFGYVQIDEWPFLVLFPHIVVHVGIVVINERKQVKHVQLVPMSHCLGISGKVYQLDVGPNGGFRVLLILDLMFVIVRR